MYSFLKLIPISVILFGTIYCDVPNLSRGHAKVGDYPLMNMKSCGYLSPKDKLKNGTETQSRIIQGNIANEGEFPWHIALHLKKDKQHICGGVLIHSFWVLTAKHCVQKSNGDLMEANDLFISLGSVIKNEYYWTVNVLSIFTNREKDLALLRLEKEMLAVQSSNGSYYKINYICLPKQMIINSDNEDAIVSGFGYTDPNNNPPNNNLRKAILLIDPLIDCLKRNFDSLQICGTETFHMTCNEDSGSGLVQFDGNRAVLIGTVENGVSWDGKKCGVGILVFTRISHFIRWIKGYIETNMTSPKPLITTTTRPLSDSPIKTTDSLTAEPDGNESQNFVPKTKTNLIFVMILILLSLI